MLLNIIITLLSVESPMQTCFAVSQLTKICDLRAKEQEWPTVVDICQSQEVFNDRESVRTSSQPVTVTCHNHTGQNIGGSSKFVFTTSMAHFARAYKYVRLLHITTQLYLKNGYTTLTLFPSSSSLLRRPMRTQCITAAVLFGAGDILAQQAVEGKGRDHDVSKIQLGVLYVVRCYVASPFLCCCSTDNLGGWLWFAL